MSFPKIISGRIDGAVQPGSEWRRCRQLVGSLDAKAHPSVMPSACALDCNVPHRIVMCRIGGKNSPEVHLAEDGHLIQTLAAQCADQTFSTAILPRRPRRDRSIADTDRPHPRREGASVGTVVVANQV